MIERILGDDGELVLPPHLLLHLVGHDRAAQAGAHDHDVGHPLPPDWLAERSYRGPPRSHII